MTFALRSGAYQYRPIKKGRSGWDAYSVQMGLLGLGYKLPRFGADGYFGDESDKAVREFQRDHGLVVDGIAGVATFREIGRTIILLLAAGNTLIKELAHGQVESECSWLIPNYTKPYSNGKRDLGAVQRNLDPTEDNCRIAFDPLDSIGLLIQRYLSYFQKYHGQPGAKTERRAWELAAGSWNAPAWTDKLAQGRSLTATQSEHIEGYIQRVTSYVNW
jgi:hypothetical protein